MVIIESFLNDRPPTDIGRVRLPKNIEQAWIEFIEPLLAIKNTILGVKLMKIGFLKGGFLLYKPIIDERKELEIVPEDFIDVSFNINCCQKLAKLKFTFSRTYLN